MMDYFKKLFMANQAVFSKGRFIALGMPIVVYPTKMLTRIQKDFIEELGQEGIYNIYEFSKEGGKALSKEGIHIAKNEKFLLSFLQKFVPVGGWGLIDVTKDDWKAKEFIFTISNSSFPKIYGKSKEPVCHITRGLFAGSAGIALKDDSIECIETKCTSKGDKVCRFEIRPKKTIEKTDLTNDQIKF